MSERSHQVARTASQGWRRWVLGAGLAGCALLAACSADKPPPAPLEAYAPKIAGRQVWETSIGSPLAGQSMAVVDGRVVVATRSGELLSLDAGTGARLGSVSLGTPLSAGVGADERHMAVVSQGNELIVADAKAERWRARLSSPVATAPLVAGGRVFVLMVDRSVEGYDLLDGRRLWRYTRTGDALTLAQRGVLQPYKDTLMVGLGSRLVGLDPLQGTVRNEVSIASARGTNEVERLSDLVGPAARAGDVLCMRAFQVAVGCVDQSKASLLWARNQAGWQGVALDADQVYGADANDRISVWKRASGDLVWTSERLRFRGLSTPIALGTTVVFGDFEGWLHFLGRERGETLLRLPTDGSPAAAPLVRSGTTLLVLTGKGRLYAFRPE